MLRGQHFSVYLILYRGCYVVHISMYLIFTYISILSLILGENWQKGEYVGCKSLFRQSERKEFHEDPLMVYFGRPSMSLHFHSHNGNIPLPSAWRLYCNVIYVTSCDINDSYVTAAVLFLENWLQVNNGFIGKWIYFGGNMLDTSGGIHVLDIAIKSKSFIQLGGLILGNPNFSPKAQFFSHKSFETGNNQNEYHVNRVRQPIICNSWHSEVELNMNDVKFYYGPTSPLPDSGHNLEMFEYMLLEVCTYDRCYDDMDEFEKEWSIKLPPSSGVVYPALPTTHRVNPYQLCGRSRRKQTQGEEDDELSENELQLERIMHDKAFENITVILYRNVHKSHTAICSFYIGLYNVENYHLDTSPAISMEDGDEEPFDMITPLNDVFNAASLESMETIWSTLNTASKQLPPCRRGYEGAEGDGKGDGGAVPSSDYVYWSCDGVGECNNAQMREMKASHSLGMIQDSGWRGYGDDTLAQHEEGHVLNVKGDRMIWMTIDSRNMQSHHRSGDSYEYYFNKVTAVDILSRLVNAKTNIDYVDTFLYDNEF